MIEFFVPGKAITPLYNTSNFKGTGKGFFAFQNTGRSLELTHSPVEWVPEPFAGGKAIWRLILTIHFHVTERLIEI
jgi:hypothetical protein